MVVIAFSRIRSDHYDWSNSRLGSNWLMCKGLKNYKLLFQQFRNYWNGQGKRRISYLETLEISGNFKIKILSKPCVWWSDSFIILDKNLLNSNRSPFTICKIATVSFDSIYSIFIRFIMNITFMCFTVNVARFNQKSYYIILFFCIF